MSLLMKALEQAARDRGEARTEAAPASAPVAAGDSKPELALALELLAADTPASRTRTEPQPAGRAAPAGPAATSGDDRARAATVMQAGGRVKSGLDDHRSINPVIAFGALAGVFAVGFAIYVYIQIYHPGWLARRPPPQAQEPPVAVAPAPAVPAASSPPSSPIPSSAVLQPAGADRGEPPPEPPRAPAPKPAAQPQPSPPSATPAAPPNKIVVSRGTSTETISPMLVEAYGALQAGNLDAAQRLYSQLSGNEPKSIDAWLGVGAIATLQGRTDDATKAYLQVLELDPRNALAQSALIGALGRGDPVGAETRLKQLIARDPSAFLFFTLGNLYADQQLWAQAQQAYFQSHSLEPRNPDYAYNLAVALEHLGQPRLALGFYRQALGLAAARGHANFSAAQAQERVSRLAAQGE